MELKVLSRNELHPKIAVVVGTRPGIIKFSPIIKELIRQNADFFIIHTGQHYSYNMDRTFFESLSLPFPKHTNIKAQECRLHGVQTAQMIISIEQSLLQEKPRVVIVGGDANTNLAGAVAARKLGIKLAHMEAGLRSWDWSMPEEHNRVMIDHISEILFAPTEGAKKNLQDDNVRGKIYVTGNTIVEAVVQNANIAEKRSKILEKYFLKSKNYFLVTFHREENVDRKDRLNAFLECLRLLSRKYPYSIIFPVHPRTRIRLEHFRIFELLKEIEGLKIVEALGHLDFLKLLSNAVAVLTDSGGVQEEACILNTPCITLRDNTERPETIEVGANILASTDPAKVVEAVDFFLKKRRKYSWDQPFGGTAAQKIVSVLLKELNEDKS